MSENYENVTLYIMGAFGATRYECKTLNVSRVKYAQYEAALRLEWLEKGKRKPKAGIIGYQPFALALHGFGHPEQGKMNRVSELSSMSMHSSFSPEWKTEFNAMIDALTAKGATIAADLRSK